MSPSRVMTDDEIYEAFWRLVTKTDSWRGYFGDDVSEDEVAEWLDRAAAALHQHRGEHEA